MTGAAADAADDGSPISLASGASTGFLLVSAAFVDVVTGAEGTGVALLPSLRFFFIMAGINSTQCISTLVSQQTSNRALIYKLTCSYCILDVIDHFSALFYEFLVVQSAFDAYSRR